MNRRVMCLVMGLLLCMAGSASADLVGHWPLDGDANDISGNGLHGTIVLADPNGQPNFIDGAVGLALDFSGGNDYVNIDGYKGIVVDPNDPNLVQPAFSITNWFKVATGATDGNVEMVTWGTSAGRQRLTWRVHQGRLRTEHASGNLRGNTYVDDGEWHHAALVVTEGANLRPDVTKQYVDGTEDTTFSGSDNLYELTAGVDVRFGMSGPQNGRYWLGALDDIRIFDHALSTGEIRQQLGLLSSYDVTPANDVLIEDTTVTLAWTAGPVAASHDVYFGTNPEPGVAELVSNQTEVTYTVDALAEEQTYYWRIDDIEPAADENDPNAVIVHTGAILSFTVPLMGAYDLIPADGEINVVTGPSLSWVGGWSPLIHAVYVSSDIDEVTNGTVAPIILTSLSTARNTDPVGTSSVDVGPLDPDTVYYWAVDEFYGTHWSLGSVLSFTTVPTIPLAEDPNLIAWWPLEETEGSTAIDMSGHGHHGVFLNGPIRAEGFEGGGLQFDGADDQVEHLLPEAQTFENFTIALWAKPDRVGQAQYSSVYSGHTPNSAGLQMDVDGSDPGVFRINPPGGTTLVFGPVTTDWIHLALVGEGTSLQFYYNGELAMTGDVTANEVLVNQFVIGAARSRTGLFAGIIDDFRFYDKALTAIELKQLLGSANLASAPEPADGAVVPAGIVGITFTPGEAAVSHDFHISTDLAAVEAGDAFAGNVPAQAIVLGIGLPPDPFVGGLTPGATYYWRIDEVNADGSVTVGKIWSFTLTGP
jgi:hypothetical protein